MKKINSVDRLSRRLAKAVNNITFSAMERAASLFGKATFIFDRGYDDNKMFLKLDHMGQDFVIRVARLYFSIWGISLYIRNIEKVEKHGGQKMFI